MTIRRIQSPLAWKIVLPFALLTLAMGAAGTLAATGELSARNQESFDRQLIHDGFVAQSEVDTGDTSRRAILRLLDSVGLSSVWNNPQMLQLRLERALAIHPDTIVETVDPLGREIVGVVGHGAAADSISKMRDLGAWPGLQYMLSGGQDLIDLVTPAPRPAVFSGAIVRSPGGTLLGAVLVGDYLNDRAAAIKGTVHDDITFYDTHGQVLTTTAGVVPDQWTNLALDQATRGRVTPTAVVQLQRTAPGPGTELLSPWSTPSTSLGYVGVLASSASLAADTAQLRLLLVALFLGGVALTLLIGVWTARRITRPVHNLVEATRLVSAGDLDHQAPVLSHDEVGELTESFNQMTRSLKEKSDQVRTAMAALQDTYLMTIEALAAAVEARDPYTHGHTRRVGDYAQIMAETMGLDPIEIHALKRACVLHDIGKIGIEDGILRKRSRLEPVEEIRMQKHPVIGVDMLKGIDFLEPALPLIRHHHERWDGNGYPDQLREDEIPLGARILAVADAADAMTSDRSYRPARTFDYAKAEILKGSGTHFDPEVVTAFIKSQRRIEDLMRESSVSEADHPQPDDLGGWRLHVIGH